MSFFVTNNKGFVLTLIYIYVVTICVFRHLLFRNILKGKGGLVNELLSASETLRTIILKWAPIHDIAV